MAGFTCATCRHFTDRDNGQGGRMTICRRNPPTAIIVPVPGADGSTGYTVLSAAWPPVGAGEWCGEHAVHIELARR